MALYCKVIVMQPEIMKICKNDSLQIRIESIVSITLKMHVSTLTSGISTAKVFNIYITITML